MDIETMHRPVWQAVSSGGSKTIQFCRTCGIRRYQPGAAHPIHYAHRGEGMWADRWDLYCSQYGEAIATGLDFYVADAEAKRANAEEPGACSCYAD